MCDGDIDAMRELSRRVARAAFERHEAMASDALPEGMTTMGEIGERLVAAFAPKVERHSENVLRVEAQCPNCKANLLITRGPDAP